MLRSLAVAAVLLVCYASAAPAQDASVTVTMTVTEPLRMETAPAISTRQERGFLEISAPAGARGKHLVSVQIVPRGDEPEAAGGAAPPPRDTYGLFSVEPAAWTPEGASPRSPEGATYRIDLREQHGRPVDDLAVRYFVFSHS